jgi:hypothetical protein
MEVSELIKSGGGGSSPVNQTNHFHFHANENGNFAPSSAKQAARQAAGQLQSGMKGR